jgi:hypothetical protein
VAPVQTVTADAVVTTCAHAPGKAKSNAIKSKFFFIVINLGLVFSGIGWLPHVISDQFSAARLVILPGQLGSPGLISVN